MARLRLVADVTNHYEELIQSKPVRSINEKNNENRFCLQRLVSVIKFIAERGLAFREDETLDRAGSFFKKFFKSLFKQN